MRRTCRLEGGTMQQAGGWAPRATVAMLDGCAKLAPLVGCPLSVPVTGVVDCRAGGGMAGSGSLSLLHASQDNPPIQANTVEPKRNLFAKKLAKNAAADGEDLALRTSHILLACDKRSAVLDVHARQHAARWDLRNQLAAMAPHN